MKCPRCNWEMENFFKLKEAKHDTFVCANCICEDLVNYKILEVIE